MLYMGASLLTVALMMALAARPVYFHFIRAATGWEYGGGAFFYYAAMAAASLAVSAAALRWGALRLRRHEP